MTPRLRLLAFLMTTSTVATAALVACGSSDDDDSGGGKDASPDARKTTAQDGSTTPGLDATTGHTSDAGTDAGADVDAAPPLHRPYALTQIIGTGQSLSVGVQGTPLIDLTQPYHNVRMDDDGSAPLYDGMGDHLSLVPLIAPVRPIINGQSGTYPENIYGQTCNEPAANQATALAMAADGRDYPVALSVVGQSGQPLTVIEKNGTGHAYAASLYETMSLMQLAGGGDGGGGGTAGSFGVGGILLTHGEADTGNAMYQAGLVQLQSDYQTDLQAITKQTDPVPLFLTQQCTEPADSTDTSVSTIAEWMAAVQNPGKIVLVGSKYQYEYAGDNLHLIGPGYVALGEKYGEAYFSQVVRQVPWRPLAPVSLTSASISGALITLHLDVAFPPLSLDPQLMANHGTGTAHARWANGDGFEVTDSTGELTIKSVALAGNDVSITLDAAPTGKNLTLAYAMLQDGDGGTEGGQLSGRHGAVRDSDPFVGRDAETIACTVKTGSTTVTPATAGAKPFLARTTHDRVKDASGTEYIVTAHAGDGSQVTITPAWAGQGGTAMLGFAHEQRNYLVQFSLPVAAP